MERSTDRLAEQLVLGYDPSARAEGDCPDAGLLAALAEGGLDLEEGGALERHLAGCESCRSITAAFAGELAADELHPSPRRAIAPRLALAASVLAVIGLALASWFARAGGEAESMDERLSACALELATHHPELAGFAALSREERRNVRADVLRGGLALLLPPQPPDAALSTRPDFRWQPSPGAERYRVELMTAEGTTLWTREVAGDELAYPSDQPALERGARYLWSLTAKGPFSSEGARAFDVATAADVAAYESALRRIERDAPAELRELLAVHLAVRRGFLGEAEQRARSLSVPDDVVAAETLEMIMTRMGSPEAAR